MNEKELNKLVKEHYGFTIEELDNDVAYWCFRCSELQQENSQLKETVNHEHKYGSEIEGKYILEREKNKKAIKYLKYLKDSTAKYSLNTWNLRKLIKILEGDYE